LEKSAAANLTGTAERNEGASMKTIQLRSRNGWVYWRILMKCATSSSVLA